MIATPQKNWSNIFGQKCLHNKYTVFFQYPKNCGIFSTRLVVHTRGVFGVRKIKDFHGFGAKIQTVFSTNKTDSEMQRTQYQSCNIISHILSKTKYEKFPDCMRKSAISSAAFHCLLLPSTAFRTLFRGVHFFFDFEKILNFPHGFTFELSCKIGPVENHTGSSEKKWSLSFSDSKLRQP